MKEEIRGQGGGMLRTLGAFVTGAAAGSIVTLLYAPASGKATRRQLGLKVQALRREAERRIGKTQRALVCKASKVREAATEWITEHVPHRNGRQPIRQRTVRQAVAH
jgi:gas vesicle protein